ncbi:MAG TPA: hypothetical protein VK628_07830 [Flavitalea sp.]|nr:hypothetical protein [Flavitalea sp.]
MKTINFLFLVALGVSFVRGDFQGLPIARVNSKLAAPILWTVDFSSDSRFYATGGTDKILKIFDARTQVAVKTFQLSSTIQCLDWNIDGKTLAIALDDSPLQLLNIETGKFTIVPGTGGSRAVAWNYNGQLIAFGNYEGVLQIMSKEGKLLRSIPKENTKTYLSVDWHPSKNIILTGSDRIRIFDTTGQMLQNINHRKENTIVLTVRWHPDGNFFATGDYGEKENGIESLLQFWNSNGSPVKSFQGSISEYRNIRWDKTGKLLATASDAMRIWSDKGKLLYTGKSKDHLWGIDWNNKDHSVVTTSETGGVKLWDELPAF